MGTSTRDSVTDSSQAGKSKGKPSLRVAEPTEAEKLAARGVEALAQYVQVVDKEPGPRRRGKANGWANVIINEIDAAAWALVLRSDDVEAHRMKLQSMVGELRELSDMWKAIEARAEELAPKPEGDESGWDGSVLRAWPWAAGRLVPPQGWEITAAGVRATTKARGGGYPLAASAPMLITARLQDTETHQEHLRIEWAWNGRTSSQTVARETALNPQRLIHLTAHGAPIDGTRLGHTVRYLADFEAENRDRFPLGLTCSRMGWIDAEGGGDRYVLGRSIIKADGVSEADVTRSPADWPSDYIHLAAAGGQRDLAAAHRTGGGYEAWLNEVATPASAYPGVMVLVYAALIPPLLRHLPTVANAILDLSGRTSQGKTTAQYVAASLWGYPDERGGIVSSWAQTPYWMESTAAFLDGLPMFLGDTRNAEGGKLDPALISSTIYTYAQGRGSGRGSYAAPGGGTRSAGQWRGVLIFTGEVSAVSLTEQGGTRARVLSLHGSPFGPARSGLGDRVQRLRDAALVCHGHFARRYVQALMAPGMAGRVKEMHAEAASRWAAQAGTSGILRRSCSFIAALEVAATLAHEIGLPGTPEDALAVAWAALSDGAQDGDRPRAAIQAIYEWAASQQHRFERPGGQPVPDCLGLWAGDAVAIFPSLVQKKLRELGHDVETTIRSWSERGLVLLGTEKDRPYLRKATMALKRERLIHIPFSALEQRTDDPDDG